MQLVVCYNLFYATMQKPIDSCNYKSIAYASCKKWEIYSSEIWKIYPCSLYDNYEYLQENKKTYLIFQ
jgi:hypothetical protein